MYNVRKVTKDYYWIGANDRRLALFEGVYKIRRAYLTILMCCWTKRP